MKNRRLVCFAVAALLLIAAVFASGVLDAQKTWVDLPYTLLSFEGGRTRSTADGDAYGVMNTGPDLNLPAGEYRLKWLVKADGNNTIRITSENNAPIMPAVLQLSAEKPALEAYFTIEEAAQGIGFEVSFEDGTRIDVEDMRLYSPMYRDHAFTLAFLLMAALIVYAMHLRGALPPERRGRLLMMAFAALIASGPALKDTVCIGHDMTFHLVRLCNLADSLAQGQFPARLGTFSYNGYGAITSVFYPDVFLYIPALLMNMGASMQYAVNTFFVAVNMASAAAMYMAAKRIFRDEWMGVCASVLYTLSIYRISDVFTRYAFGEMTAMIFLPLFLLGLYEVVLGDKDRWLTLALGAAGIFLSHMLSTLICGAAAVGVGLMFIVKIVRERRLGAIVRAAGVTALLCAFQLVPFLMYSAQGIGAQSLAKDPIYFALHPAQLFLLGAGELSVDPADSRLSTFALEIGLPLLIGGMLALYAAATQEERDERGRDALLFAAAGMCFALMATTLFPWSHVRVLTRGLTDYLQFPWRFLMMTSALLALAGGWGCVKFSRGHGEQMTLAVLALCAVCALPTLTDEARNPDYIAFGETVSPDLAYVEYTIPGTQTKPTRTRDVLTSGDVQVTEYRADGARITAQVSAGEGAAVSLPIFGYDGYRAELDGEEIAWTLGENNRLTVPLEAGTQGTLKIWFAGKPAWRMADGVSLLTVLALCAARRRRKAYASADVK
ncbi:MAG: hypothetical protein IKK34_06360 [Clostridia bacterium]|nr:hypothetical protein [Clostridia bacterium]